MKKIALVLLFVLAYCSIYCQENQYNSGVSNLEAFSNRKGTFILQESKDLGYFSDVMGRLDFTCEVLTDLKTNEKKGGITLTIYSDNPTLKVFTGGVLVRTKFYIDYEEIETLSSFFTYFKDNLYKTEPTVFTSVKFISTESTEYSFTFSPASSKKNWLFKVSPFPYTNEFTYFLKKETVDNLLNLLNQSKEIIIEKTNQK